MYTAAQTTTGLLSFEGGVSRQAFQPLPACKHFLNLTNGLEAVPLLESLSLPYSFVRIQSTWYGLEFVTYVLRRLWFQRCTDAWLRRQNVTSVFEAHYNDLQKTTVAKLRYYMRYIPPGVTDIQLYGVCKATVHDPDPGYYRDIVHKHLWNGLTTDTTEQQPSSQQATLSDAQEAPTGAVKPGSRELGSDAQALLASYGFKVAFGGIYCIDDYRAM
ncbi:hypothetical protein WJX82_000282 [Trebouxia sp. C0006]